MNNQNYINVYNDKSYHYISATNEKLFLILNMTTGDLLKAFSSACIQNCDYSLDIQLHNNIIYILTNWEKSSILLFDTVNEIFLNEGYMSVQETFRPQSILLIDGRIHLAGVSDSTSPTIYISTVEIGHFDDLSEFEVFINDMDIINPTFDNQNGLTTNLILRELSSPETPILEFPLTISTYVKSCLIYRMCLRTQISILACFQKLLKFKQTQVFRQE
jgi:hypothetical protein